MSMSTDTRSASHNLSVNHKVALNHARAGTNVFPCRWDFGPPDNNGDPQWKPKAPMPRVKWTEASTTDIDIINAWWTQWPLALVGMPLAPLNLVVLDPDRHPGAADGIAAFDKLGKAHPGLLGGPYVQTPQGQHHFYRQPAKHLGNGEGSLPAGINVRGDGGYVIAPGSVLPDGSSWVMHGVLADAKELPLAVIEMLTGKAAPESHSQYANGSPNARELAYAKASIVNAIEKLKAAQPGHRNNTLNIQAIKLAHFVVAGWIGEPEMVELLTDAATEIGLDDSEIGATIRSALDGARKHPRRPVVSDNDTVDEFWDFEPAFGEKPPKQKDKPRIWKGDELWDIPPVSYLIDNIIPRGTVGLMIGASQTFKSFMALDMALSIAQGMPKWHGHAIDAPEDAIVLYIAGEGGVEGISQRRRGWASFHKFTRETMRDRFRLITHGVNLTSRDSRALLVQAIKEQLVDDNGRLVLIVVDTMNTVASGADENSTKEMGALHNICVEISQQFDTAVMGVHHTNKKGDVRGSSVLTANMDFWFLLKRRVFSSKKIEMEIGKLKEADAGHKEKYEMKLVGIDNSGATTLAPYRIGAEEDEVEAVHGGRPASRTEAIREVLADVADGLTLAQICAMLGVTERKERDAIYRCLRRGTDETKSEGFVLDKTKWRVRGGDDDFLD